MFISFHFISIKKALDATKRIMELSKGDHADYFQNPLYESKSAAWNSEHYERNYPWNSEHDQNAGRYAWNAEHKLPLDIEMEDTPGHEDVGSSAAPVTTGESADWSLQDPYVI